MFEQLRNSINALSPITEEEFLWFISKMQMVRLEKKDFFIRAGDMTRSIAFVNRGCLRYFYTQNGQQFNCAFVTEGEFIADYASFLAQRPAVDYIEALETCELFTFDYQSMQQGYEMSKNWERFGRKVAEYLFVQTKDEVSMLRTQSPEARYLLLMEQRPEIFERVSQANIASYLGVQPESLSRIRRKLAENNRKTDVLNPSQSNYERS